MTFFEWCTLAQSIGDTRGNNQKIQLFADAIATLTSKEEIVLFIRFFAEGALPANDKRRMKVGHRTIATVAASFMELDYDLEFKPCRTATGSSSEAIEKLMEFYPTGIQKRQPRPWTLQEIQSVFETLASLRKTEEKGAFLEEVWAQMTSIEIKYLIRLLHTSSLRIGFELKSMLRALSKAFNLEIERIRYAHMLSATIEDTVKAMVDKTLSEIEFAYFQPISFMLATPLDQSREIQWMDYIAEEKFDGMRCQIHWKEGEMALFSRDENEISSTFPEIASFFKERNVGNVVLDGEIVVFKEQTIQPFQLLQKRMGVKKPSQTLMKELPVLFIAYDMLVEGEQLRIQHAFTGRRARLEAFTQRFHLPISSVHEIQEKSTVHTLFKQARAHGNEGLMLKKKTSPYEFGQRGLSWFKVKEPGGSIDTIIMYAHAGSGKRGGLYSDFTLGIRVDDDDRYQEKFIPIGKSYGGYSNEELKKLNKAIKPLIVDRFGPTLSLKPGIVVEIEFDEIQRNKRTKAGYTLRLPRFRSIRWDLSPKDTDTLRDVEHRFKDALEKERLSNDKQPFMRWEKE